MTSRPAPLELREAYDYLVVGGGPAGCAFAASLVERGIDPTSVLVVDRECFPRDKICGDGWTHNAIPLIREIFPELRAAVPGAGFVTTMEVYFPAIDRAQRFVQNTEVVPRRELDTALWRAIQARGVATLEGARVHGLLRDGSRVGGATIELDGTRREVRSRLLVGADGSAGVVRKATGSTASDRRVHAVRQYVRGLDRPLGELKFILDHDRRGYFWAFPLPGHDDHAANIGYISFRPGAGDLIPRFRELKASPAVRDRLGGWREEGPLKAFPLNLAPPGLLPRRPKRPPWGEGFILLGDAAALVAPYSGEGIAFALWSGRIAARTLDPEQLEATAWQRRYGRRLHRLLRWRQDRIMAMLLMELPWRLGPSGRAVLLTVLHRLAGLILLVKPEIGSGRVVGGGSSGN